MLPAPLVRRKHAAEQGNMSESRVIHIAIIGTGTIRASWAAFLARGLDVVATDAALGAEVNLRRGH